MYSCYIKICNYLSDMLNLEMDKQSIWFKANNLPLNLEKTKFMVFKLTKTKTFNL